MLARLGDIVSSRVAALLMRKTGWKGELYCIAASQCHTDCLYGGEIVLAMKLLEDKKDKLGGPLWEKVTQTAWGGKVQV